MHGLNDLDSFETVTFRQLRNAENLSLIKCIVPLLW